MKKKKLIYFAFITPLVLFGLFYLWIEYRETTQEIVNLNDISITNVSKADSPIEVTISGDVKLGKFEKIHSISAEQKDGTIYLYLTKIKGYSSNESFSQQINKVLISHDNLPVKNIKLVSGKEILVTNEEDHNKDFIDVKNYSDSKILW